MKYLEELKAKKSERKSDSQKDAALKAFKDLSKNINTLLESLETTGAKKLDKDFIAAVKSLEAVSSSMKEIRVTSDKDIKTAITSLAAALANIEFRPVVNVSPPKVEVKEREIDFKPLIDKINTPVKVQGEVSDYRAQDLDELSDPTIQYVGFVNARGGWYIIENNTLTATLRYKFGKRGYVKGWESRTKHTYRLYHEAINEVSS